MGTAPAEIDMRLLTGDPLRCEACGERKVLVCGDLHDKAAVRCGSCCRFRFTWAEFISRLAAMGVRS